MFVKTLWWMLVLFDQGNEPGSIRADPSTERRSLRAHRAYNRFSGACDQECRTWASDQGKDAHSYVSLR